ncbi:MAG TPA: FtsQ-type POTRA domain-containing protein [Longimicrobiaceae bacterium]|nr:FtsQ-type POTRA domain-containing protein [Longimicrobiaceae bacterium]
MARTAKRRYGLPLALGAGGLLVLSAPVWGPGLGRQIGWLDVDRVEISGATLVAPHEVLRVSGIARGISIFDEREGWAAALEAHPIIARATITRRLPNTLRVRVLEERPVALVSGEALTPATAAGHVLPLDPTAVPIDLPIVPGLPDDEPAGSLVRLALAEAGRLADLDPLLMADVSEIRPAGAGALVLVHPIGEIMVPSEMPAARLGQLKAVLADLSRRIPESAPGATVRRPVQIDLRFDGQVVVRHPSPRELSSWNPES